MKAVTNSVMAEIDRAAQRDFSYPPHILMENAGLNCLKYLENNIFNALPCEPAAFICGRGNNGGDALVMARHYFLSGKQGVVIVSGEIKKEGPAKTNLDICLKLGIPVYEWKKNNTQCREWIDNAVVIIDGIAGTGIKGALGGAESELAEYINSSNAFVCSIDTPSGIGEEFKDRDICVKADLTITVGLSKICLYTFSARKYCGDIVCAGASFPEVLLAGAESDFIIEDAESVLSELNNPEPWAYKNIRGHAAVMAGSEGKTGAAWLASYSALKSRAGLVTLYTARDVYEKTSGSYISVMVKPFMPEKENYLTDFKYNCFIAGPGWGTEKCNREWLKELLLNSTIPAVIDADALTILSDLLKDTNFKIKNNNCILTPHIGEFSRLTGISVQQIMDNSLPVIKDFCRKHNVIVVLKSFITWICYPDGNITVCDRINPALGTAGSGDVLSGVIGGLLASGCHVKKAALQGVFLHSIAGKLCREEKGFFTSEELPEYIQKAVNIYAEKSKSWK